MMDPEIVPRGRTGNIPSNKGLEPSDNLAITRNPMVIARDKNLRSGLAEEYYENCNRISIENIRIRLLGS